MSYRVNRQTLVLSKRDNLKGGMTSCCPMKYGASVAKSSDSLRENKNSGSKSSFLRVKYNQQIHMFWTLYSN